MRQQENSVPSDIITVVTKAKRTLPARFSLQSHANYKKEKTEDHSAQWFQLYGPRPRRRGVGDLAFSPVNHNFGLGPSKGNPSSILGGTSSLGTRASLLVMEPLSPFLTPAQAHVAIKCIQEARSTDIWLLHTGKIRWASWWASMYPHILWGAVTKGGMCHSPLL